MEPEDYGHCSDNAAVWEMYLMKNFLGKEWIKMYFRGILHNARKAIKQGFAMFMPIHAIVLFHRKTECTMNYYNPTICASDRLNWADWLKKFNYLIINRDRIYFPYRDEIYKETKPTFCSFSKVTRRCVRINILDIKGVSESKSNLSEFSDLKVMAKEKSPELLSYSIKELLSWDELNFNTDYSDFISVYSWDAQPYLMQSGGSHHFASAQYRSAELNQSCYITLPLEEVSLDLINIQDLLTKVSLLYASSKEEVLLLSKTLDFTNITYMRVESPYGRRETPPYTGEVFVISLRDFRHRYVAKLLKHSFVDIGEIVLD